MQAPSKAVRGATPRRRQGRWIAGAALVCLFGHTSALLHTVFVEHARCPEHGESMHVGAGDRVAIVHVHVDASHSDGPAVRNAAAAAQEHGHEHCLGVCDRRGATVPPKTGTVVSAPLACDAHAAPHALLRAAARPLFLLAPKNSPPA